VGIVMERYKSVMIGAKTASGVQERHTAGGYTPGYTGSDLYTAEASLASVCPIHKSLASVCPIHKFSQAALSALLTLSEPLVLWRSPSSSLPVGLSAICACMDVGKRLVRIFIYRGKVLAVYLCFSATLRNRFQICPIITPVQCACGSAAFSLSLSVCMLIVGRLRTLTHFLVLALCSCLPLHSHSSPFFCPLVSRLFPYSFDLCQQSIMSNLRNHFFAVKKSHAQRHRACVLEACERQ
jgi:hypothetical protein